MGFSPKRGDEQSHIWNAALVIFFPFVIVSLISLSMLYQIDGNYFMLLYSMLILGACRAMVYFKKIRLLSARVEVPGAVAGIKSDCHGDQQLGVDGWIFGDHLLNKGRVNHRAQEQARIEEKRETR